MVSRTVKPTSVRAFTLVELMISIAIVVVLMIGITKVFSLTSSTAGATNTIAAGIRDARAAQTVFYNDLNNTASDMPFMILRSGTQLAYRNKADKLSDRDGQINTVDVNGNNTEGDAGVPGEQIKATDVNNRNHRVDVFSFFDRGLFPRQTGNALPSPGVYVADMTSQEAWIWYGHLRLLNNAGTTYFDPGDTSAANVTNDNNQYASDWVLGREAILLKSPNGAGAITDRQGTNQYYIPQARPFGYEGGGTFTTNVIIGDTPFAYSSKADDGQGTLSTMQSSRYDLAGTSISTMSQQVSDYLTWLSTHDTTPPSCNWWSPLMSGDLISNGPPTVSARFQARTYVSQPMKSSDLAYTSPLFVQHCSQFIVEYAGDFVSQDANPADATYGQVTNVYTNANGTDGLIDFVVDANGNRSIRWYGLPRDTNGDGTIPGQLAAAALAKSPDVVPLRDLWMTSTTPPAAAYAKGAPFERDILSASSHLQAQANYVSNMSSNDYYECVWGPSDPKPKMIRITMTIDDPTGKLPEGQTFQYVIALH